MLYCIDCGGLPDARTFHELLCQTLDFPLWYGHNLDALYDCLTDLESPVHLQLISWESLPDWKAAFAAVFQDAENDCDAFSVTFA